MARKLAWLIVALIAVVDLVLISTMLRGPASSRAAPAPTGRTTAVYPAPEMISPTRAHGGVSVAGPSVLAAPRLNVTRSAAPAGPAPAPTGGIEVLGVSRVADPSSAPSVAPAAAPERILLAVSADGWVVRAARGSCPATMPTALSLSADAGASWIAVDAGVPQVLGVGVGEGGAAWYVGTDETCRPVERESAVAGAHWGSGSVTGRWYLSPDPESTVVASPALVADVGCVPLDLAAVDVRRAVVACAGGDIRATVDGGDSWATVSSLPGAGALAFATADRGFALVAGPDCGAEVLWTEDGGATWAPSACLGAAAPRAVAAAADTVVAQIGSDLLVSRDDGRTWHPATG